MDSPFADILRRYVERSGYTLGQLERWSTVPKRTIANWINGVARHPRHWHDLLRLARVLKLDEREATTLLQSAGFPAIAELNALAGAEKDRELLAPWAGAARETASPIAAITPHELPAPPADFVGRSDELRELTEALEARGACIVGLFGMGGIGKTTLALVLARQLMPRYPDAQFYLDLKGHSAQAVPAADALKHVVRALFSGQVPDDESALQGLYRSALHGRRALLLFDNAADAAHIAPLIPPAESMLIVTSRVTFALPGLVTCTLDVLPAADACALLRAIAPHVGDQAEAIAALCGYLPLALRAAGSYLAVNKDVSPAQYAERLRDERTRLERIGAEGVAVGVEASFSLSYVDLPADAARVFRQLAVFPGSFDAPAAEAVCGDREHHSLTELVRRGLVLYDPIAQRYRLHDLGRLFANARLPEGERHAARLRHARHYLAVVRQLADHFQQGGELVTQALAIFDLEWPNLQAGQAWAAGHIDGDAALAGLCSDYAHVGRELLRLRLLPREQIRWSEAALRAAQRLKRRDLEADHLDGLATAYHALGDPRQAAEQYEQALAIFRELRDRRNEARVAGNLGLALIDLGEPGGALEHFEQHLTIAREIRDLRLEANALGNLGVAFKNLGEFRRAIECYEQALAIDRSTNNQVGAGSTLIDLGNAYLELNEPERARPLYEQALDILRALGDRRHEAVALTNLGLACATLGHLAEAIAIYEQTIAILRAIGDRFTEGITLANLGEAYARLEDHQQALIYYDQAIQIARAVHDRLGEADALWKMSKTREILGDRAAALACAQEAAGIFAQLGHPDAEQVRQQLAEWLAMA